MEASTVYFTDFRCPVGTSLTEKLRRLCLAAGIRNIDMDGRLVAIKMHFGELGNLAYLRPNYAKVVADLCKEQGGLPFLTDCNTLYPGSRKNALEHLGTLQMLQRILAAGHTPDAPAARMRWSIWSVPSSTASGP